MDPIAEKILTSVGSALILSLLSLLFSSVRTALFFKQAEYDLTYKRGTGPCEWDIQWEGFRLTIATATVSNDYLKSVVFRRNKRKDVALNDLEPSNSFIPLFDNEIQVKLESIVRKQQGEAADYAVRFVFRRRRLRQLSLK
jgi:hypothetical protein